MWEDDWKNKSMVNRMIVMDKLSWIDQFRWFLVELYIIIGKWLQVIFIIKSLTFNFTFEIIV